MIQQEVIKEIEAKIEGLRVAKDAYCTAWIELRSAAAKTGIPELYDDAAAAKEKWMQLRNAIESEEQKIQELTTVKIVRTGSGEYDVFLAGRKMGYIIGWRNLGYTLFHEEDTAVPIENKQICWNWMTGEYQEVEPNYVCEGTLPHCKKYAAQLWSA